MIRLPVILFAQKTSPYFAAVERIVARMHDIVAINPDPQEFEYLLEEAGVSRDDVWVISAENPVILGEPFLSCKNFNIHRAPPWYPGWGGLVRALVDRRSQHGVVAHQMIAKIDAGEILDQEMFAIDVDETFIGLNDKTCHAGLTLLEKMCTRITLENPLLRKSQLTWATEKMSMKQVMSMIAKLETPWARDALREYASSRQARRKGT